jgi:hypothetical protein
VAFDLQKGRLWLVCRLCRRWSLVPLETRWEALEELQRVVSKGARLLSKTENVSLYGLNSVEIVRIGTALEAEEAWWRYGRQLPPRSRWSRWTPPLIRLFRFGTLAWVGEQSCTECGFVFHELPFADRQILVVRPGAEFGPGSGGPEEGEEAPGAEGSGGSFSLTRRCPRCRDPSRGGLRLKGVEAELTLARVMAYQNHTGESRVTVQAAARLLRDSEGPASLVGLLSRHGRPLGDLQPMGLTALEITVVAARERSLMRLEVQALQARWRREEDLAALVDGELSPVARIGHLVWRARGGG